MSSWSDFFSFSNCLVTWLASPLCRVMASRTGVAHTSNASRKARVSIGTNQGRICSKNCSSPRVILSLPLRLLRCFRFFFLLWHISGCDNFSSQLQEHHSSARLYRIFRIVSF
jgi:hypothetical protein